MNNILTYSERKRFWERYFSNEKQFYNVKNSVNSISKIIKYTFPILMILYTIIAHEIDYKIFGSMIILYVLYWAIEIKKYLPVNMVNVSIIALKPISTNNKEALEDYQIKSVFSTKVYRYCHTFSNFILGSFLNNCRFLEP